MESERIELKAKGYIKILNGEDQILWEDHNAIGPDMLMIVTRCLTQLGFNKQVDTIRAIGDFGTVDRVINETSYTADTNTITFKTTFYEFDFDGNLTDLRLLSLSLGGALLALREELNIDKDGSSRLKVEWSITISNC